jgi:hypothetical protein
VWLKVIGSWAERDLKSSQVAFGTSFDAAVSYGQSIYGIQGGFDLGRESLLAPTDTVVLGLMGGYASSEVNFKHSSSWATLEGGTLGVSGTYVIENFFADTQFKVDFLEIESAMPGGADRADATTIGSTSNLGYRFAWDSYFVSPIATFAYARTRIGNLTFGAVTLDYATAESARAGFGLQTGATLLESPTMRIEGSILGRVWNEFLGENDVDLVTTGLNIRHSDDFTGVFGEIKGNLDFLSKDTGWSGFANLAFKFNEDFTAVSARAGARYQW